jgi:hypothetical protein
MSSYREFYFTKITIFWDVISIYIGRQISTET